MLNFPFDLTEAILSSIGSSSAFLSLALTCTFWANHIIPRHIQYRTLWLGLPDKRTLDVWAHLAMRKDFAKNIRDVRLISSSPEDWRYPTSLVTPAADDLSEREAILKALANIDSLQRFSWQPSDFGVSPLSDRDLASVLKKSKTLDCLKLTSTDDSWIEINTLSGPEVQNHSVRFYEESLYSSQADPYLWLL